MYVHDDQLTCIFQHNDREKDYLRMSHAHMSQNELLQKLQDRAVKVKRLEDACRKQEKVIEKMEKILNKGAAPAGQFPRSSVLSM